MAVNIISPPNSFLRFNGTPEDNCIHGVIDLPLPVVYSSDYAFQWILTGATEAETDGIYGANIEVGLVNDCDDLAMIITFPNTYTRSKKSPTQILYNWGAGFPGFTSVVSIGECFRVRVRVNGVNVGCSNSLKRIAIDDDTCFTSVISYSSDSGGFGFFDCGPTTQLPEGVPGGGIPYDEYGNCISMDIPFTNVPNISIPITAEMVDSYGVLPSVQIWIYNELGILQNIGISAQFLGGYPPTGIYADFGGNSSGIIHISQ